MYDNRILVPISAAPLPPPSFLPSEFENLQKGFLKAKVVVQKEGETPRFYLRSLTDLEDFVKDVRAHMTAIWFI